MKFKQISLYVLIFAFDDLEIPGMAVDGTLGYEFFKRAAVIIRFYRREMFISLSS
ncbi:MAG: hypothetical protein FWE90_13860 [Defluviitaleaceae bacterium]|nr:hypothetical protein [Defluviitaleaceae bacterium]